MAIELRAGRSLSQVPGLTTLYAVTPGEDRKADVCVGIALTTALADLIVAAVNHSTGWMPGMHQQASLSLAGISWEAALIAEGARATERERIAGMLREGIPWEFLERHGLQPGAGPAAVLAAAAAEIEGTP